MVVSEPKEAERDTNVTDLMSALEASLERTKPKRKKRLHQNEKQQQRKTHNQTDRKRFVNEDIESDRLNQPALPAGFFSFKS